MSATAVLELMAVGEVDEDILHEAIDVDDVLERLPVEDEFGWFDSSDPNLWLYRDRTVAILKRYMRLSVEVGRLPSLLGREFFRGHVTRYQVTTFEDVVIFVHDVERCLEKLDEFSQQVIAKCILLDYTQDEAARMLNCWRRTIGRRLNDAVDRLSEVFLEGGLLKRIEGASTEAPETCQEGKTDEKSVSDCVLTE